MSMDMDDLKCVDCGDGDAIPDEDGTYRCAGCSALREEDEHERDADDDWQYVPSIYDGVL